VLKPVLETPHAFDELSDGRPDVLELPPIDAESYLVGVRLFNLSKERHRCIFAQAVRDVDDICESFGIGGLSVAADPEYLCVDDSATRLYRPLDPVELWARRRRTPDNRDRGNDARVHSQPDVLVGGVPFVEEVLDRLKGDSRRTARGTRELLDVAAEVRLARPVWLDARDVDPGRVRPDVVGSEVFRGHEQRPRTNLAVELLPARRDWVEDPLDLTGREIGSLEPPSVPTEARSVTSRIARIVFGDNDGHAITTVSRQQTCM
jgi:hypothetical protein